MRKARKTQPCLTESWLDQDHSKELRVISGTLDEHPEIYEWILQDLRAAGGEKTTGAEGWSAEQVLRSLLIKQMNGFSYRELAFHLADSKSYRTFCKIGVLDPGPSKSSLAEAIKAIRHETLVRVHREILGVAEQHGVEKGRKVRVDCTVVESPIHDPSDSSLLRDGVRVMTRIMGRARELLGPEQVQFHDRSLRTKRRCVEIRSTRRKRQRVKSYRDLVKVCREVVGWAEETVEALSGSSEAKALGMSLELSRFIELTRRVLDQTCRRVFQEESVPAEEKIVSIFEDHTDIICKDRRDTYYGHKICLTGGASSMILDCVVLDGNPADSTLTQGTIERQIDLYDRPPRQAVFDGAFASKKNLRAIKGRGVDDVAFSKRKGLDIAEMVRSSWVYRCLKNFRAGIEGNISFLKRTFGLDRCTWKSLESFKSYVWSSILSFNLLVLARHLLA